MRLTISTWNINSVRLRINLVAKFIKAERPDVICLQETKCPDDKFPLKRFARLGYNHVALNGQKGYHGVAVVSRVPFDSLRVRDFCSKSDCRHIAVTFGEKAGLYGTLRGRVGTTTGPAFLYVTGGAAFARIRDTLSAGGGVVDSSTKTATGWTYGGGTEVALDPRWSLKLEYLRIKLSDDHRAAGVDATFEPRFTVVRVGLNYKFGDDFWGKAPVVAKY